MHYLAIYFGKVIPHMISTKEKKPDIFKLQSVN